MAAPTPNPLTRRILSMASRTVGVAADEVPHGDRVQIHKAIQNRAYAGQLHSLRIAGNTWRFFATPELRAAYIKENPAVPAQKAVKPKAPRAVKFADPNLTKIESRAMFLHDQRGNAPWSASEPGIITEKTVVTVCPAYQPRFQEHVLPFVHGGLRSA